jgi:hypothetical protein
VLRENAEAKSGRTWVGGTLRVNPDFQLSLMAERPPPALLEEVGTSGSRQKGEL